MNQAQRDELYRLLDAKVDGPNFTFQLMDAAISALPALLEDSETLEEANEWIARLANDRECELAVRELERLRIADAITKAAQEYLEASRKPPTPHTPYLPPHYLHQFATILQTLADCIRTNDLDHKAPF